MKSNLAKICAAVAAATLVCGTALAQTVSQTNFVTQGVFSTAVDDYASVRNWSAVPLGRGFVAAEVDTSQIGLGVAVALGDIYLAADVSGNLLHRRNFNLDGGTDPITESGRYGLLIGFGREIGLPLAFKIGLEHQGNTVHVSSDATYTPNVSVGVRLADLGPMSLFRAEIGLDSGIPGDDLGSEITDYYSVAATISPNFLAQARFGRHDVTLQYKPLFFAGQNKAAADKFSASSHYLKAEYGVTHDFDNGLALGLSAGGELLARPAKAVVGSE